MQDNKSQTVPALDYEFVCHYKGGEVMFQNYGTEEEKNFGHIDLDNLEVFELYNKKEKKSFELHFHNGMFVLNGQKTKFDLGFKGGKQLIPEEYRLIYFRRIRQDFAQSGGVTITVRHCFGWQTTINDENYQRLIIIEPDGSVTFSNKK